MDILVLPLIVSSGVLFYLLVKGLTKYLEWSTLVMIDSWAPVGRFLKWYATHSALPVKHSIKGLALLNQAIAAREKVRRINFWMLFFKDEFLEKLYELKFSWPDPNPPPEGLPTGSPFC